MGLGRERVIKNLCELKFTFGVKLMANTGQPGCKLHIISHGSIFQVTFSSCMESGEQAFTPCHSTTCKGATCEATGIYKQQL